MRIAIGVVLVIAVVVLLFTVVFPWVVEYQQDPTLDGALDRMAAVAFDGR